MGARHPGLLRGAWPAHRDGMYRAGRTAARVGERGEQDVAREALKIGLGGLGAVGLDVARRIEAGIPGLVLTAVSVRDRDKARRNLPQVGDRIPVVAAEALAETCDLVVECLPPAMFRAVALSVIERGKLFMPLSVGQLLDNWDLVARAKETGARILVPTGGLIGLDAVRAAAEGTIRSVTMITRKPPNGLDGAPYLVERGISLKGLNTARKVFDGTAGEGARGFPQNVNVAAALMPRRHRAGKNAARNLGRPGARPQHASHRSRCRHRALCHVDRERAVGKSAHRPHRGAEHGGGAPRAGGGAEGRDLAAARTYHFCCQFLRCW